MKTLALTAFLVLLTGSPLPTSASPANSRVLSMDRFIRTELYFGRSIPSGGLVSEGDWQKFVDEIVTPRFPDGLTVLDAEGQWRGKGGLIVREASKVIVLVYPRKKRREFNRTIEEVRAEYKLRFSQESVMRIDITKPVEVTF